VLLKNAKWYIKWSVDDVLRWKGEDFLTIEPSVDNYNSNAKIVWYDQNWQPIIDITRSCVNEK
jgi:hypothetical protein